VSTYSRGGSGAAVSCRATEGAPAHPKAGVSNDTVLARFYASARTLRIVDGPDAVHIRGVAKEELARDRPYSG